MLCGLCKGKGRQAGRRQGRRRQAQAGKGGKNIHNAIKVFYVSTLFNIKNKGRFFLNKKI